MTHTFRWYTLLAVSLGLLIIAACSSSPSSETGAVPDWTTLGFPIVLAGQDITPTQAATITAGVFTVEVPRNAFDAPVKFELLTGEPTTFEAKSVDGEVPVLAFAFRVTDLTTHKLVGTFNQPVRVTVTSPRIVPQSKYYNIAPNGKYSVNKSGLQVEEGKLTHPIKSARDGWLIMSPSSAISGETATANMATVMVAQDSTLGGILTDGRGMSLYVFKQDRPEASTCTGACAELWPPLAVSAGTSPTAGSGVSGDLGVIKRDDGSYQVTYNKMPLYLFAKDTRPGDTSGQDFGGLWHVVQVTPSTEKKSVPSS